MPLIRYIQKITRDPNFLVWRDTVYINADGRPQYLSLKLVSDIDALLQGKVSEYIFQSEFKEVKLSCNDIKVLGRSIVAEYLHYEGSGTTLHDTSGNKHDATISGATWKRIINGKYYLEYDGIDDYTNSTIDYSLLNGGMYIGVLISVRSFPSTQINVVVGWDWWCGYVLSRYNSPAYGLGVTFTVIRPNGEKLYAGCDRIVTDTDKWVYTAFAVDPYNKVYKAYAYNNTIVEGQAETLALLGPETMFTIGGRQHHAPINVAYIILFNSGIYTMYSPDKIHDILYNIAQIMVPDLS